MYDPDLNPVQLDAKYLNLEELHERIGELLKTQSPYLRTNVRDVDVDTHSGISMGRCITIRTGHLELECCAARNA